MNWLNSLEKRFGRFGIRNLMLYIVGLNAVVFFLNMLDPTHSEFLYKLYLIPERVFQGEVWRLVTYIFIPPTFQPFWLIFALYFYYMIGTNLEHEWGTFKFNLFYLLGMVGTTVATLLTGGIGTPDYLNLTLFLAFAFVYPDYQLLIFFILPVKVKYLALLDVILLAYSFFAVGLTGKVAIVVSLLNFLLFFGKDILIRIRTGRRVQHNRRSFEARIPKDIVIHRCKVCGRTEKDDKDLEFRYCVDCEGDHEYCMEHLHSHEHVK